MLKHKYTSAEVAYTCVCTVNLGHRPTACARYKYDANVNISRLTRYVATERPPASVLYDVNQRTSANKRISDQLQSGFGNLVHYSDPHSYRHKHVRECKLLHYFLKTRTTIYVGHYCFLKSYVLISQTFKQSNVM